MAEMNEFFSNSEPPHRLHQENLCRRAAGLFIKISSIALMTSSVNLDTASSALTLAWTCSTFDAPVMALETRGFLRTQACARVA